MNKLEYKDKMIRPVIKLEPRTSGSGQETVNSALCSYYVKTCSLARNNGSIRTLTLPYRSSKTLLAKAVRRLTQRTNQTKTQENSGTSTYPKWDSKQYPTTYVSSNSLGSANRIGMTNSTNEKVNRNKTSNRIREKVAFMRYGQAYIGTQYSSLLVEQSKGRCRNCL